jgi:hypothetical protein
MGQSAQRLGYGLKYRFPARTKPFFILHSVQTYSGAHPASHKIDTGGCFLRGKASEPGRLMETMCIIIIFMKGFTILFSPHSFNIVLQREIEVLSEKNLFIHIHTACVLGCLKNAVNWIRTVHITFK